MAKKNLRQPRTKHKELGLGYYCIKKPRTNHEGLGLGCCALGTLGEWTKVVILHKGKEQKFQGPCRVMGWNPFATHCFWLAFWHPRGVFLARVNFDGHGELRSCWRWPLNCIISNECQASKRLRWPTPKKNIRPGVPVRPWQMTLWCQGPIYYSQPWWSITMKCLIFLPLWNGFSMKTRGHFIVTICF